MIAVDTSALIAIVQKEPEAAACARAIETADRLLISAGTFAEALIVAGRRNRAEELTQLVEELPFEIEPVNAAVARRVSAAHGIWGKGFHPAGLNFGDCFAYEVAKRHDCPLLYIGNDFAQTDLRSALD